MKLMRIVSELLDDALEFRELGDVDPETRLALKLRACDCFFKPCGFVRAPTTALMRRTPANVLLLRRLTSSTVSTVDKLMKCS
eukprot:2339219-Prymnesium_polylepis.1